jgi:hypothetical protein
MPICFNMYSWMIAIIQLAISLQPSILQSGFKVPNVYFHNIQQATIQYLGSIMYYDQVKKMTKEVSSEPG